MCDFVRCLLNLNTFQYFQAFTVVAKSLNLQQPAHSYILTHWPRSLCLLPSFSYDAILCILLSVPLGFSWWIPAVAVLSVWTHGVVASSMSKMDSETCQTFYSGIFCSCDVMLISHLFRANRRFSQGFQEATLTVFGSFFIVLCSLWFSLYVAQWRCSLHFLEPS